MAFWDDNDGCDFQLAKIFLNFHRELNFYKLIVVMVERLNTELITNPFNVPLSGTTRVSWYQKGKTNLGHMQVCTSLQADNHASTSLLSFLQAGCPSCRPTNSVKALKAERI